MLPTKEFSKAGAIVRILIRKVHNIDLSSVVMMTDVKRFYLGFFLAYNYFYFRLYVAARIFLLAKYYPI